MIPNTAISLTYCLPEPYDLSSVHQQMRDGIVWYIVWTCKKKPEIDYDHRVHFGRGEDKDLMLALDKALRATMDHEKVMNAIKIKPIQMGESGQLIGEIEDIF